MQSCIDEWLKYCTCKELNILCNYSVYRVLAKSLKKIAFNWNWGRVIEYFKYNYFLADLNWKLRTQGDWENRVLREIFYCTPWYIYNAIIICELILRFVSFIVFFWQRWVWLYRKADVSAFFHTNNGVERQNKDFKSSFLSVHCNKTLSGMVTSLVEEFLPSLIEEFLPWNIQT
jgi:hypothetical protein